MEQPPFCVERDIFKRIGWQHRVFEETLDICAGESMVYMLGSIS